MIALLLGGASMSKVVERDASAFVMRGGASLVPRGTTSVAPRATRNISDWVFAGYLSLAAIALLYTLVQARRFDHALVRLRSCIAHADSACTSAELQAARKIHSSDIRLDLAEASLGVLLHDVERAEATLASQQKETPGAVESDVRADWLLLRGDVAAAQGNATAARDDFQAARLLVEDADLVSLRLKRIEANELAARARAADELDALRKDFSDLFVAAEQGKRDITELSVAKAQEWLGRVSHLEARQQLILAVDAARRASNTVEADNRAQQAPDREPPKPPVRGSYDYSSGYYGSYEAQLAVYREHLDRFNKERAAADDRKRQRSAEAFQNSSAAIDQGKTALERALQTLQTLPNPLRDAATSSTPSGPIVNILPGIVFPGMRPAMVVRAYDPAGE